MTESLFRHQELSSIYHGQVSNTSQLYNRLATKHFVTQDGLPELAAMAIFTMKTISLRFSFYSRVRRVTRAIIC
ncbi:unnamed protein product [Fusarium fujikuroi]|uniref:Uncharacterized protein n=1 Tax=Fusarium fujikuroi TaxID=5127 RepID=A0A9Q9UAJ6_FUSFU|nr:unnamed protein product [Fusarium fujikuroi]